MGTRALRPTGAALLLVTGAGCAGLVCLVSVRSRAASDADTVRTLVLGLADREDRLQTLQGTATAETFYDADTLATLERLDAVAGAPGDLEYKSTGLHRIAFWVETAEQRWRIEVAELVATGLNEWGLLTNYGGRDAGPVVPVLIEVGAGGATTQWDVASGHARIKQFDPRLVDMGGHARAMLGRYLRLGYAHTRPEGYVLAGTEVLDGVTCHKLVSREKTPENLGVATLWVAPEMGFAPARLMALSVFANDPKRGSREVIETSWKEVGQGLWLPESTTISSYSYTPEAAHAKYSRTTVRFSQLRANAPISECRFGLQLPLGTLVAEADDMTVVGRTDSALAEFGMAPLTGEADPAYVRPLRGNEVEATP